MISQESTLKYCIESQTLSETQEINEKSLGQLKSILTNQINATKGNLDKSNKQLDHIYGFDKYEEIAVYEMNQGLQTASMLKKMSASESL